MSTLDRIDQMEKDIASLKEGFTDFSAQINEVKAILMDPNGQLIQMVAQRSANLEQHITTLAKTLAALSDELIQTEVVTSDAVMNRLRDAQDRDYYNQVQSLKDQQIVQEAAVVGPDSLVVISQAVLDTQTGETKEVSNYRLIPMGNPMVNPSLKENLQGKEVGQSIDGNVDDVKKEIITVQEIYNLTNRDVVGETQEQGVSFESNAAQE